jgi:hypothetical protein
MEQVRIALNGHGKQSGWDSAPVREHLEQTCEQAQKCERAILAEAARTCMAHTPGSSPLTTRQRLVKANTLLARLCRAEERSIMAELALLRLDAFENGNTPALKAMRVKLLCLLQTRQAQREASNG